MALSGIVTTWISPVILPAIRQIFYEDIIHSKDLLGILKEVLPRILPRTLSMIPLRISPRIP